MNACDGCLRRSHLVRLLAPQIATLLDRPGRRSAGLLALADCDLLKAMGGGREDELRAQLRRFDPSVERQLLDSLSVFACCRHDAAYPGPLADLTDPPAVLFSTSAEPLRTEARGPAVSIVGTRAASPYGLEVAYALARGLGAAGVPVVSGLALGIDGAAHRGCLDAGGHTIAVLAGGVDVPYPRQNRRLHERIAASGAVVSEMPPGQKPFRWSFPARNRIMAGLTDMAVIVEAADPSGSLITADFARDLGRAVAAVPGRITARTAAGTNGLLRDGAIPVTGVEDVLDELFGAGMGPRPAHEDAPRLPARLRTVLDGVEAGLAVGAIAERAGLPAGAVRAALAQLEDRGLVAPAGIGRYERRHTS